MTDVVMRTISEDEEETWLSLFNAGFLNRTWPGEVAPCFREVPRQHSWAVFAGTRMVSTLRMLPTTLTLPGSAGVACGAMGYAAVLPGLQGKGYYRQLQLHLMRWGKEHGLAIALGMISDEGPHRKLGWGHIARLGAFRVDTRRVALAGTATEEVRQLSADEFLHCAQEVFHDASQGRPGTIPRDVVAFENLASPMHAGPGRSQRYAIICGKTEFSGYAVYDATRSWDHRHEAGFTVTVTELIAKTPEAETSLLAYLLGLSLVTGLVIERRTIRDHLPLLFKDERGIDLIRYVESLGARIIDVPRLLEARKYLTTGTLTLEVTDRHAIAAGTYRLDVTPSGAECLATTAQPDLRIEVGDLALLAMASCTGAELARAGRLGDASPSSVAAASAIFSWPEPPWSPTHF